MEHLDSFFFSQAKALFSKGFAELEQQNLAKVRHNIHHQPVNHPPCSPSTASLLVPYFQRQMPAAWPALGPPLILTLPWAPPVMSSAAPPAQRPGAPLCVHAAHRLEPSGSFHVHPLPSGRGCAAASPPPLRPLARLTHVSLDLPFWPEQAGVVSGKEAKLAWERGGRAGVNSRRMPKDD